MRQPFAMERTEEAKHQPPAPWNAVVINGEPFECRQTEMDDHVWTRFKLLHRSKWNIFDEAAVHQHMSILIDRRQELLGMDDEARTARHNGPDRCTCGAFIERSVDKEKKFRQVSSIL